MKSQYRQPTFALIVADTMAFVLVFALAVGLTWLFRSERIGGSFDMWWYDTGKKQMAVYAVLALCAMLAMGWRGHYSQRIPFWDELLQLVKVLLLFGLFNGVVVLLLKLSVSRFLWPVLWGLALVLVPFIRQCMRRFLLRRGSLAVPTVIIGAGAKAREAYRALQSEPLLGFDVQAFIALGNSDKTRLDLGHKALPVYSASDHGLTEAIDSLQPVNIIIALSGEELSQLETQIEQLGLRYRHIYMIPALAGLPLFGVETLHFFSHEVLFLRIHNNLAAWSTQWLKRGFDIIVSGLSLIVLAPLFAWIAWYIRRDGGNVFFGHTRIGRHGTPFPCYKFRSMVPNAEAVLKNLLATDPQAKAEWDKDFKLRNDPRITPIGHFLRKTSLDELPQLWNVLKGEMSLVGPRPIIEAELERYEDKVDFYLCTRPGVTGLWQVSGRNDIDYRERVALDAWYVKNWNLWYDIAILFKTVGVVLKRDGAY